LGAQTFLYDFIVLENQRVKLVPFSEEYEAELREFIFDDGMDYSGAYSKTNEDVDRYINKTMNELKNHISYPFIVIDKATNEVAGSTRYGNISFESLKLEIGWTWYGKKFRGSGLNKACKFELLKFAFETINFRRVQFSADIDNIRSQKAILKLGAKQEGIFRANDIDSDGNSRDEAYFSIIHTEWDHIKNKNFINYLFE